jgi:hypothetical protein
MTIPELIVLTQARIAFLMSQLTPAQQVGDVERVLDLQGQIDETQLTLNRLQTLV